MASPYTAHITSSNTTHAARCSAGPMSFRSATFVAVKSFDGSGRGVANADVVHIGMGEDKLPFACISGREITISAPAGVSYDLREIWFLPTVAADGLAILVTA